MTTENEQRQKQPQVLRLALLAQDDRLLGWMGLYIPPIAMRPRWMGHPDTVVTPALSKILVRLVRKVLG